jgi:hypothetical protein
MYLGYQAIDFLNYSLEDFLNRLLGWLDINIVSNLEQYLFQNLLLSSESFFIKMFYKVKSCSFNHSWFLLLSLNSFRSNFTKTWLFVIVSLNSNCRQKHEQFHDHPPLQFSPPENVFINWLNFPPRRNKISIIKDHLHD